MLSICPTSCLPSARLHFRSVTGLDVPAIAQAYTESALSSESGEDDSSWLKETAVKGLDKSKWKHRILTQFCVLVEYDGMLAGFASLKEAGYIDLLYVRPKFQRLGIASKLYCLLENHARRNSSTSLRADVSINARPFFEKQGFIIVQESASSPDEPNPINYAMFKPL